MNFFGNLSLYFAFGIVLESLFLLRSKSSFSEYKRFLFVFLIALAGFIPGKNESWFRNDYEWTIHWYLYWLIFTATFTYEFRKIILPIVTELTSTVSTLLLAYVYFTSQYQMPIFTGILTAGIVAHILLLSYQNKLSANSKLFMYVWYLFVNLLLSVFFLLPIISNLSILKEYSIYGQITIGMSGLFLFTRLWAIYYLVPSRGHGINEIVEHGEVLVSKVSDYQAKTIQAMSVISAMLIIFCLNYNFFHVSTATLISFILIGAQFALPIIMPRNTHG